MEQETTGTEKLQKVLARLGIASRRVAEVMISEGRKAVNSFVSVRVCKEATRISEILKSLK